MLQLFYGESKKGVMYMINIDVQNFKPGMVVEEDIIKATTGACMVRKGTILTEDKIYKLRRLGIKSIKVDRIKYETLLDAEHEKEKTISSKLMTDTGDSLKKFMKEPNSSNMESIQDNAEEMVKAIEKSEDFKYSIETYKNDTDMESHATRVACFSVLLAKLYNKSLKTSYPNIHEEDLINLEDIAVAALFHDIGTTCSRDEELAKIKEIPNMDELAKKYPGIIQTPLDHYDNDYSSVYSFFLVQGMGTINKTAQKMILLSKEPEGENGVLKVPFEINTQRTPGIWGAKIIRVCDLYDKCMKMTLEENTSLENVAMTLGQLATNRKISPEILQLLFNDIPLYPVGTKVILSTGELATVEKSRFRSIQLIQANCFNTSITWKKYRFK